MTDLIMTAAQTYVQHPHLVAAASTVEPSTLTQDMSYYMYSVLAAVITGAVTGVIGYFVGKRGLTATQADLSNVKTAVTNVPAEVKKIESEVTAKL